MRAKFKQFTDIFIYNKATFDIQVNIKEIKEIRLSYTDVYMWMFMKGHSILFDIELSDGTMIRLLPNNLYLKKENCLSGIEYMENRGIVVEDPYHLKDALRDKTMRFAEYIDEDKKHES